MLRNVNRGIPNLSVQESNWEINAEFVTSELNRDSLNLRTFNKLYKAIEAIPHLK